jgi:hypothetical protein
MLHFLERTLRTGNLTGDATSDGQRFMVTRDEESKDKPVTQLQIVLNWTEELKLRVRAK